MKVEKIIAQVIDVPEADIKRDSSPANFGGWTSLKQLTIISIIESEAGIKFTLPEIKRMRDVEGIINVLTERGIVNV